MLKYGFFGGSFNPVTKAHIQIAKKCIQEFEFDKVILVPVGSQYPKQGLATEEERYQMLQLAIHQEEKLEVSNLELGKNKAFSTIEVFQAIQKQYPQIELYFIMGADNLEKLPTWNQAEQLVRKYQYIIIQRQGYRIKEIIQRDKLLSCYQKNFQILENEEHSHISATQIREAIQQKKTEEIRKVLVEKVYKYISTHNLYQ